MCFSCRVLKFLQRRSLAVVKNLLGSASDPGCLSTFARLALTVIDSDWFYFEISELFFISCASQNILVVDSMLQVPC